MMDAGSEEAFRTWWLPSLELSVRIYTHTELSTNRQCHRRGISAGKRTFSVLEHPVDKTINEMFTCSTFDYQRANHVAEARLCLGLVRDAASAVAEDS